MPELDNILNFLPKDEEAIRGTPIKQFIECLIDPISHSSNVIFIIAGMDVLPKTKLRKRNRHFGGFKLFQGFKQTLRSLSVSIIFLGIVHKIRGP